MTREELISKIDGLEISEETKIELMEDITDLDAGEDLHADYDEVVAARDEYKNKYEEVRENYKKRFMTSEKDPEEKEEVDEEKDEVIDIKEI